MKKILRSATASALLALTYGMLALCDEAGSRIPVSVSTEIVAGADTESEDMALVQTTTSLYDEYGLITAMIMENSSYPGEKMRIDISYILDEMGNPVEISFTGEDKYVFKIENSYIYSQINQGGAVLTKAAVTDVMIDGTSVMDELEPQLDPPYINADMGMISTLQNVSSCVQYFSGYRNMEFCFGSSDMVYRYDEDGRIVYQSMIFPRTFQTTTTRYLEDGSIQMVATRMYQEDGSTETTTQTIETDGDHRMVSLSMESENYDDQWNGTVYYQYDRRIEEKTGRLYLNGTIRETVGSTGPMNLPSVVRYYLDSSEGVVQEEFTTDYMTRLTDFDGEGRMVRQELGYLTSDTKTIMTYSFAGAE